MSHSVEIMFPEIPFISQCFTVDFKGMEHLLAAEKVFVEQSASKRQMDFSTGRYCARQALSQLINDQPPILQGANREPVWPDGVVGSISHSEKLVGGVVALQKDVTAIGLDIETPGGVQPEMWNMLFHPSEQELIRSKKNEEALWATLLFSLKEAFYKMQYPLTNQFLDFMDVSIAEAGERLCFTVNKAAVNSQLIVLGNVEAKWMLRANQLLSICYITAK